MGYNRKKIASGLFWKFAEKIGAQIASFIVQIYLARLLTPDDYGTVALVLVFINVLQVFIDNGLGVALIQKKESDNLDFSSVFYFNLGICIILYGVIFIVAPLLANFYNSPSLTSLIRVLAILVIISGFKNIQQSYVSINLIFKKFFFATIGGTIVSGAIGILMAYRDCGVWAIVAQQLLNALIDTIILWFTVKWRPQKQFSWIRVKVLISYGWKLVVAGLINVIFENIRSLIIGRVYSSNDLGFYNRGKTFPRIIVANVNSSIDSVLFPTMSKEQDDVKTIKDMARKSIRISSFVMWPMMTGLFVCAAPLVKVLLTDKWLPCVPYLQIFCITFVLYPIHTANLNAIKAIGRSDLFLKLEVIKIITSIIIIVLTVRIGVTAIAIGYCAGSFVGAVINAFPNRKLLDYSLIDQIKDILPSVLISVLMGAIIYPIQLLRIPQVVVLLIMITLGVVVYIGINRAIKSEDLVYCLRLVSSFVGYKKSNKSK